MSDFAIVRKGLHQYELKKGEYLDMPHIDGEKDASIEFDDVLLVSVGDKVQVGQPTVAKAKVKATILKQFKGPKYDAAKFKAKSRYRKHWGYREEFTRVRVDEITVG